MAVQTEVGFLTLWNGTVSHGLRAETNPRPETSIGSCVDLEK